MSAIRNILLPALFLMALSCVEPYAPPEISGNPDFLVVDGFLNATSSSCSVRLTRAVAISSDAGFAEVVEDPSNPIEVWLEDEQGSQLALSRISVGLYEGSSLPIDINRKYRLVVDVPPSEKYASDFVAVRITPAIDDIFFEATEEEVKIFLNTSDASGSSNHYRWTWDETWEYTTPYYSMYKIVNGKDEPRPESEQIYRCYRTDASQKIMVASSTELNSDAIRNFEIQQVARSSQKLQYRYSLNVKQMALTEEAYTYWYNLYKTTENVGGLFDPMPGEVRGNFQSVKSSSSKAIGFFSASTVEEKRIFIATADLPLDYNNFRQHFCEKDTVLLEDIPFVEDGRLLIGPVYATGFPVLIGYTSSDVPCIDCRRLNGGVTEKPSFWP
jgi:hypothetical protein